MEKINNTNTRYEDPTQVLISVREPYDRNTIWIQPHNGVVDLKVYNKGWVILSSTKDNGLSKLASTQVDDLVNNLRSELQILVKKSFGRCAADSALVVSRCKSLETKVAELEEKLDILTKRYSALLSKLSLNGN